MLAALCPSQQHSLEEEEEEEEGRKEEEVVGIDKQKGRMCVYTATSHKPTSAWQLALGNAVG